jgi:hypothetical protein
MEFLTFLAILSAGAGNDYFAWRMAGPGLKKEKSRQWEWPSNNHPLPTGERVSPDKNEPCKASTFK